MSDYLFPPPRRPSLPIVGRTERFPIRRIWCVGRNYAAHAREMGADPERETPFFFAKPADAALPLAASGANPVPFPPQTENLHHEVELVVALDRGGVDLSPDAASGLVCGQAIGLDLTRRDLQNAAKSKGQPWEMGKAFDASAPIGPLLLHTVPLARGAIWLEVNGQRRQQGDLADMIWSVPEILAHLSRFVTLAPGDLVFTGTPEGVGRLQRGDAVRAGIDGLGQVSATLA